MNWLVENTLVAAALAGLVFAVCRVFQPRPALAHLLWLVVLGKLLCPALLRLPLPFELPREWRTEGPITLAQETHELAVLGPDAAAVEAVLGGDVLRSRPLEALPTTPEPASILSAFTSWSLTDWLLAAWALGSFVMLVSLVLGCARVLRIRRHGSAPSRWLRDEVAFLAGRLGIRPPRVVVSSRIGSAFVFGFGRPTLMWPTGGADRRDLGKVRSVLAHELAHLRRHDHWTAWLELAATVALWWHPLMWWARARLRLAAELACDAWAIWAVPEARHAYASALIDAVERDSQAVTTVPVLAARPGARAFEKRLKMILNEDVPRRLSAWAVLPVAALSLTILSGVSFAQERKLELRKKRSTAKAEQSDQDQQALRKKILKQVNAELRKSLGKSYQVDSLSGIDRVVERFVQDTMKKANTEKSGGKKDGTERQFQVRIKTGDGEEEFEVIELPKGSKSIGRVLHGKGGKPRVHVLKKGGDFEVIDLEKLGGDHAKGIHERILRELGKDGKARIRVLRGDGADVDIDSDADIEKLRQRIRRARSKDSGGKDKADKRVFKIDVGGDSHDVHVIRAGKAGDLSAILKKLHGKAGHPVIRVRKHHGGENVEVDVDVRVETHSGKDGKFHVIRRQKGDHKDTDQPRVKALLKVLDGGELKDVEIDTDAIRGHVERIRGKVLDAQGNELRNIEVRALKNHGDHVHGLKGALENVRVELKQLNGEFHHKLHGHLKELLHDHDALRGLDKDLLKKLKNLELDGTHDVIEIHMDGDSKNQKGDSKKVRRVEVRKAKKKIV